MEVFGVPYQNNLVKSVIEQPGVRRLAKMTVGIGPVTGKRNQSAIITESAEFTRLKRIEKLVASFEPMKALQENKIDLVFNVGNVAYKDLFGMGWNEVFNVVWRLIEKMLRVSGDKVPLCFRH